MGRGTQAVIDLSALRNNALRVRQLAPASHVLTVVKADAYGHGLKESGKALVDCSDGFGVATFDEAMTLKQLGVTKPILLMQGALNAKELIRAATEGLHVVVHQSWQCDLVLNETLPKPLTVWLKVNTGMNRLGVSAADCLDDFRVLSSSHNVQSVVLMSHFACMDKENHPLTAHQQTVFKTLCAKTGVQTCSMANSAAVFRASEAHFQRMSHQNAPNQWVRPGLMLYGGSPLVGVDAAELGLQPVMQLESRIISRSRIAQGDAVGYGATWLASKDTDIAIVSIGYGDGYPRHMSSQACVLIEGVLCPLAGRVSMDMIAVDVSQLPQAAPGSKVVLWGKGLPIETVAEWAGTVNYELMCQVSRRVPRVYENECVF